jgi:alpha-amylase
MRSICFYFQVHQPVRLKTYRFFDIGRDHYYYDDYLNRTIIKRVATKCYLPANKIIQSIIKEYGSAFKVSYSLSGTVLEQLEMVAPEVIESFQKLAATGSVEFLAETYAHSLASLNNKDEFTEQVRLHSKTIERLFGHKPKTFRNTELIYSDDIGEMVQEMGYDVMLTEGAKHILGWKSPNYLYCSARTPKLKLLLRNFRLSDDISFRFSLQNWSEWPLTATKFAAWLRNVPEQEEVVNIFIDYETFGEHQWKETGIFDFLKDMPKKILSRTEFKFRTPAELSEKLQPVAAIHVASPISWADEERDLTAWLGNELQDAAFSSLYAVGQRMNHIDDPDLKHDWYNLQASDHFYYMCTKWFSDGEVHKYFNPYSSPYDSFINYMNVVSDFILRVDKKLGQASAGLAVPIPETAVRKTTGSTVKKPAAKTAQRKSGGAATKRKPATTTRKKKK